MGLKKIKKISSYLIPILVFVAIPIFLRFLSPNVADPDAFYHLKHALIYRTQGLFDSSFPWAQYSVVKDLKCDMWWGFHMLSIPLTFFSNTLNGIYLGTALNMFLGTLLIFFAFKNFSLRWPLFWTLIFIFSSQNTIFRLFMFRPHVITLGLCLFLFSLLTKSWDEKGKGKWVLGGIFLISFLISWLHTIIAWIPLAIFFSIAFFGYFLKFVPPWKKFFLGTLGIILGVLLRPNPTGCLKLFYMFSSGLAEAKKVSLPLDFGLELQPLEFNHIFWNPVFVIIAFSAIVVFILVGSRLWKGFKISEKIILLTSLLATPVFFLATIASAARSYDYFAAFGTILAGLVFCKLYANDKLVRKAFLIVGGIAVLVSGAFLSLSGFKGGMTCAITPNRYQEAAVWLKENTKPGEIVFHSHWDQFGPLFFWNSKNYYINAMDPILEYKYSPDLAWKHVHLAYDFFPSATCGVQRCSKDNFEDTYKVLKEDFKASYVFVTPANKNLYSYMSETKGFKKVFEVENQAIFKIIPR